MSRKAPGGVKDLARKMDCRIRSCLSGRHPGLNLNVGVKNPKQAHGIPPQRLKVTGDISKIVCISDTHCMHRALTNDIPVGDILIHAGDFTRYGTLSDAEDFNHWLGELPHKIKIVILGNHESSSSWNLRASQVISNAVFLRNSSLILERDTGIPPIHIYGTDFYWPSKDSNHAYGLIPADTNILLSHGPPKCDVDGAHGCPSLRKAIDEKLHKCNLFVCGHIHYAHGVSLEKKLKQTVMTPAKHAVNGADNQPRKDMTSPTTLYINAACAGHHRELKYPSILIHCTTSEAGTLTFSPSSAK